jgi:hypothetical protein
VTDGEGDRFDLRHRHGHAHQPVSAVRAPQDRVAESTRRLEEPALYPTSQTLQKSAPVSPPSMEVFVSPTSDVRGDRERGEEGGWEGEGRRMRTRSRRHNGAVRLRQDE